MARTDIVVFANLLALTRFLKPLYGLLCRHYPELVARSGVAEVVEALTGVTMSSMADLSNFDAGECAVRSAFDDEVSPLMRERRHTRYVKVLLRHGIPRKEAIRFVRDHSPTSRNQYLPAPANGSPLEDVTAYNDALAESINFGSFDLDDSLRLGPLLEIEPGYWTMFEGLGWELIDPGIHIPGAPIMLVAHESGLTPVFKLDRHMKPFATRDIELDDVLLELKNYIDNQANKMAVVLWESPQSMQVNGLFLTSIGMIYLDDEWCDFLINEDVTSLAKLIELNQLVTEKPGQLALLSDRQFAVHTLFASGHFEKQFSEFPALESIFPAGKHQWSYFRAAEP